jgi:hypothetical protein
MSSKSFLEPKYRGLTYADIKVPEAPKPIQLAVHGQTNGKANRRATDYWRRQVERVLNASRVFVVKESGSNASLVITINNVADVGSAAGKGFMTGLTFGGVGTLATDGYVMTVEYVAEGSPTFTGTYQHAIYTTIGNAKPPPGIDPITLSEAPSFVAEDMLLHFLKELEQQPKTEAPNPVATRPE